MIIDKIEIEFKDLIIIKFKIKLKLENYKYI